MNKKTTVDIFWKLVGVLLMFIIIEELGTVGVFIDLLILGVYYEATADTKELAGDTGYDESDIKKRIEVLEKKLEAKS